MVRGHGVAAEVEARYLAGAGVGAIEVEDSRVAEAVRQVDGRVKVSFHDRDRDPDHDHDPAWAGELSVPAREVALGAHRALRALREVVLAAGDLDP